MDFLDRFEEQLLLAGRKLGTDATRPVAATPRVWRSRRALAATVAILLVGGTALAATHPWSPQLGDPKFGGPSPTVSGSAPPEAQLALLGVLRRKPTGEDRDAATQATLRYISGHTSHGVHTDYIRRLATSGSDRAVTLVPLDSWSPSRELTISDALCVFYSEPAADGGARSCWTSEDVRGGRATGQLGDHIYGLVPDGVAEVEAQFNEGQVVTAQARDNFFDLLAPRDLRGSADAHQGAAPVAVSWLDANGHRLGPPAGHP